MIRVLFRYLFIAIPLLMQAGCEGKHPLSRLQVTYKTNKTESVKCIIRDKFILRGFEVSEAKGIVQDKDFERFFFYIENENSFPVSIHNIGGDGVITIYIYEFNSIVRGENIDINKIISSIASVIEDNISTDESARKCGY